MRKKIVAFTLVIAMLAMCFGATLAYFTDTDSATNVMTMGKVDIEQIELERCPTGGLQPFTQGKMLLPMGGDPAWAAEPVTVNGDSFKVFASANVIDKIVTVENNGNTDAYVRTIVALEAGKTAEEAKDLWYNYIGVSDNSDNGATISVEDNDLFVKIGDSYYIIVVYTYEQPLAAGAKSGASLTGVALYKNATQQVVATLGAEYEILVLSQAVQAADMGTNAGAALDTAFGDVNAENVAAWFASLG